MTLPAPAVRGCCLRSWTFLLLLVQRQQGNVGHLHHLEADSGNITDGVTLATESGNQHLVVLLDVVQATIPGHERGNLLAVLDQLHTDALADGGVRLLGLDADLFQHDSLGVGRSGERIRLPAGA
uniref:Secreted protein n=1 Tax=Anopheles atroparvus TaxID=41427 RepID=A0AAG5CV59_ANOAO